MKKKILIVLSVSILITLIVFLTNKVFGEEDFYNEVVLSQNNSIVLSSTVQNYYDTVISVGLDVSGIKGNTIIVEKLSDAAKNNFGGQLDAHVRYFNGIFYLFIDDLNRQEAIKVISHEIAHMDQYLSQRFVYEDGVSYWDGEKFESQAMEYEERPWEIDAFNKERDISLQIANILLK